MLFYEKGIQILKEKGNLNFITSNKWLRAEYGKTTRKFLSKQIPLVLIDLGSGVFDSATVDTNILHIQKGNQLENHKVKALDLTKEKEISNFEIYLGNWVEIKNISAESWSILDPIQSNLKSKIEKIGKPLKDWEIQINYGIKTGFNDAFFIDTKTKEQLCNEDPKSIEILKPLLRGRDIKRYVADWAGLWLIATFPALHLEIERALLQREFNLRKWGC